MNTDPKIRVHLCSSVAQDAFSASLLARRLYHRRHGSLRPRQPPVRPICMDLIAAELRLAELAGNEDGAARPVNLLCMTVCLFGGKDKDLLQHLYDVVVGMVIVVEKHYTVQGDDLFPL